MYNEFNPKEVIPIHSSVAFCMHGTIPYKRWIGVIHIIFSKEQFKHLEDISGKGLRKFMLMPDIETAVIHFFATDEQFRVKITKNFDVWQKCREVMIFFVGTERDKMYKIRDEVATKWIHGTMDKALLNDCFVARKIFPIESKE